MASPSAAPGAAWPREEHLWVQGCLRRAIAQGGWSVTPRCLWVRSERWQALAVPTQPVYRQRPRGPGAAECVLPGGQPGCRAGYLAGSCSGCVRVFPTAPNDLTCRGLDPEPWPHGAGCCAQPSFPKGFRDQPAGDTPRVRRAEGPPAQRCPHVAAMGLLGRGQAAWQETAASSPLPRAAGREAGKSGLESLTREEPLAEGRWEEPRSTLSVPLQEEWVFN